MKTSASHFSKLSSAAGTRPNSVDTAEELSRRRTSSRPTFDVIVVGGGAIGCTTAYFLREEGLKVALADRRRIGREASWASAGMIGPVSCPDRDPWFVQAATLSRELYDELNEQLHEETGRRVDYGGQGELVIAFNDSEAEEMKTHVETQASDGVSIRILTGEEVRKQEPALPEQAVAAIWKPEGRFLDARNYTKTVAQATSLKGVSIHEGWPVNGMLWEENRVVGVRSGTDVLLADTVINAAGAWAGKLDPRLTLPIFPDHGQILSLEGPSCGLHHNISRWEQHGYMTPRTDGRVIVGATHDDWGFQKKISLQGLRYLHQVVRNLLPNLADQPILEIWSGLRPGTPDDLAVLGPDPRVREGYLWATGHSTYGMTQTPATAKVLTDLVLGRTPRISTVQLRIERFWDKPR